MGGCLALVVLFFAWLIICAMISAFLGVSTEAGMVLGTIVTIVIGVIVFKNAAKEGEEKKKIEAIAKEKIDNILNNSQNFTPDESYINTNNSAFISVDEKKHKFL